MHVSIFHSGIFIATLRFSYLVVEAGNIPPGVKALTGSLSPCWANIGFITFFTKSGSFTIPSVFTFN